MTHETSVAWTFYYLERLSVLDPWHLDIWHGVRIRGTYHLDHKICRDWNSIFLSIGLSSGIWKVYMFIFWLPTPIVPPMCLWAGNGRGSFGWIINNSKCLLSAAFCISWGATAPIRKISNSTSNHQSMLF